MLHNDFDEVVRKAWRTDLQTNEALLKLAEQLDVWNKEIFGNLFKRKRQLWRRIEGIQSHLTAGGLASY